MQVASAHHKRYTPGVKPHRPYLPPHIRPTGKLDGVCELCAAIASLVSPVVVVTKKSFAKYASARPDLRKNRNTGR